MSKLLDGLTRLSDSKNNGTSYKGEYEYYICYELGLADKAINVNLIPESEKIEAIINIDSFVPRSSLGYYSGLNYSVDAARNAMIDLKKKYNIQDFDVYQRQQSVMQQPVMQAAPVMKK